MCPDTHADRLFHWRQADRRRPMLRTGPIPYSFGTTRGLRCRPIRVSRWSIKSLGKARPHREALLGPYAQQLAKSDTPTCNVRRPWLARSATQVQKMKRSRFGKEQVFGILADYQAGLAAREMCLKRSVRGATFYKWHPKCRGMASRLQPRPPAVQPGWQDTRGTYKPVEEGQKPERSSPKLTDHLRSRAIRTGRA